MARVLGIVWALPWTVFGLSLGMLALMTGGRCQRKGRVLEIWGGAADWLLRRSPIVGGAAAITFGHVVLGRTKRDLESCREHELVHVRQYERWGPLFIPAYLLLSLWMWIRGKSAYRDNPFEVEAYDEAG